MALILLKLLGISLEEAANNKYPAIVKVQNPCETDNQIKKQSNIRIYLNS